MATVGYGQNISQAPLRINVAPAEDALVVDISGETYPRWALKGSGNIILSAGTIAPDAGIRRDGTGIVAITDGSNGYGDLFIRNTLAFFGTGPYKVRSETNNDLMLETTTANAIVFSTAQTPRWNISSSGHLLASTDNAYDIGSTANRARNIYVASGLGIGITTAPEQKLHVAGKIKIGNDATAPSAGTIRWTGTNFEGYDGTTWKTLDVQAPSGGGWTEDTANNAVYVTNSGRNVGIGISTPDTQFQVYKASASLPSSTAQYEAFALYRSGTSNIRFGFGISDAYNVGWIQVSQPGYGNRNLQLQPFGGLVGIGSSPPENLFFIRTPSAALPTTTVQGEALMLFLSGTSNIRFGYGIDDAGSRGWIQVTQPGFGYRDLILQPMGGGVALGGYIYPSSDSAIDVGNVSLRFRDGYFANLVSVRKDQGDYGGNFATYTPPAGREGAFLFAVDTNATNPGRRMYVYLNGAWRYVNLS